jgi:hypothetical protein
MTPHTPGEIWTAGRKPAKGGWIGLKAHIRGISPKAQLEMHRPARIPRRHARRGRLAQCLRPLPRG